MTKALRLLPLLLGLPVASAISNSVEQAEKLYEFAIMTVCAACLAYIFFWYNILMARRAGHLIDDQVIKLTPRGHISMAYVALIMGGVFTIDSMIVFLVGYLLLWFSCDWLIRAHVSTLYSGRPPTAADLEPSGAVNEGRAPEQLCREQEGGKEVLKRLMEIMKDEHGVHMESLFCALGALAGYSCQVSVRAQAHEKGLIETADMIVANTLSGKRYYFGAPVIERLTESEDSIWELAMRVTRQNRGEETSVDIHDLYAHAMNSIGEPTFGHPRLPAGHNAGDSPANYLKTLWPVLSPLAKAFCKKPSNLSLVFGFAIQDAIKASSGVLAANVAQLIAMESAIPMSMMDLSFARRPGSPNAPLVRAELVATGC